MIRDVGGRLLLAVPESSQICRETHTTYVLIVQFDDNHEESCKCMIQFNFCQYLSSCFIRSTGETAVSVDLKTHACTPTTSIYIHINRLELSRQAKFDGSPVCCKFWVTYRFIVKYNILGFQKKKK